MTILIQSKNGFNWKITIGRNLYWSDQVYLITIIKEWRENREVTWAEFVRGFFKRK